jgi:hypothetical protein
MKKQFAYSQKSTDEVRSILASTILAVGVALCFTLAGCVAPKVGLMSTSALQHRNAEIQKQVDDDRLGYFFGPTRWVSHAIQERNLKHDQAKIQQELVERRIDPTPAELAED